MKLNLLLLMMLFTAGAWAQAERNPYPRTITVTGTAEREVIPDEIYVNVVLREYERKAQPKMSIEKIRQDFLNAVKAAGIPDSAITIAAYDAYTWNPWWRKKRKEDLLASITYQLKLKNSKQMDDIVERLDDQATQNFYIQKTTHSQLEEYKKQLKIQAVKEAKEKAGYLAQAIGESLGVAVTIHEPREYYTPYMAQAPMMREVMMKQDAAMEEPQQGPVDFRKIKLKYDVTVVFALK